VKISDAMLGDERKNWELLLTERLSACLTDGINPDRVWDYLCLLSSEHRAPEMVALLDHATAKQFWTVFIANWHSCDDTWAVKDRLLCQLRKAAAGASVLPHYSAEQIAFFESLPEVVTVYRGCSRERVNGISWTINREVAKDFTRGHRGIYVPDPIIVTATVKKSEIMAVFVDRAEQEIICVAKEIRNIENFSR
jgi:hypothetical protein